MSTTDYKRYFQSVDNSEALLAVADARHGTASTDSLVAGLPMPEAVRLTEQIHDALKAGQLVGIDGSAQGNVHLRPNHAVGCYCGLALTPKGKVDLRQHRRRYLGWFVGIVSIVIGVLTVVRGTVGNPFASMQ